MNEPTTLPSLEPSSPPGRSSKLWLVWLAILAVVVLVAFFFYKQHEAAQEQQARTKGAATGRPVLVAVAPARQGDIGVYVEALGTVTPLYTVSVTSRVQGQITKVYYREGQFVRKGDPLLDIDSRPYQAALTQAEGQLARDQAALNEAKIDLERYQAALAENAIARQQVDDQAQVVRQDEGTVKNDEGTVENARVNLAYTHITSPIEGRVGLRLVDPGNIVQANSTTPLVVVTRLQPITVIFSVAEDYLPQIQQQLHAGHKMPVQALDRTAEKLLENGTLSTIDNQIDTTTGTVKLRATFSNREEMLFPNQFVNAKLLLDTEKNVTLVPTQAIQRGSNGAFVFVIEPLSHGNGCSEPGESGGAGEKAEHKGGSKGGGQHGAGGAPATRVDGCAVMRNVTAGVTDANDTAVQGVNPGENVATNGFDKLQDGSPVMLPKQGKGNQGESNSQGAGGNAGNTAIGAQSK